MANTKPAIYTVQLGPTVTPEIGGELKAWGLHVGMSLSEVAREAIEHGLPKLRTKWTRSHGTLPGELLAKCVDEARERGERQVKRRRDYDDRTRNPQGAAAAR